MLIWRQPITRLMMPNTGSTVCLRRPYSARPACVLSRCAICTTGSVVWGCGASGAKRCASGVQPKGLFDQHRQAVDAQPEVHRLAVQVDLQAMLTRKQKSEDRCAPRPVGPDADCLGWFSSRPSPQQATPPCP